MKLVEILARELKEWPEGAETLVQVAGGFVYQAGVGVDLLHAELSVDWMNAEVTRSQWEAERARIATNQQATQEARKIAQGESKRSKEYQALWDRAFLDSQKMIFDAAGTLECLDDIAYRVGKWADAFMAERAKRMKG